MAEKTGGMEETADVGKGGEAGEETPEVTWKVAEDSEKMEDIERERESDYYCTAREIDAVT